MVCCASSASTAARGVRRRAGPGAVFSVMLGLLCALPVAAAVQGGEPESAPGASATSEVQAREPGSAATEVVASPAPSPEGEALSPAQRYKKGKNVFEYGDCAATIELLAPLAVPGTLQDAADQLEVHRMLGICFVLAARDADAAREFASLLSINPEHVLDPFLTPPAAVELFEREKAAMALRLEELKRAREQARQDGLVDEGGVLVERTTVVRVIPMETAFLPFGLAQATQGDTTLAVLFGVTQGVLLATNVALFWSSVGVLAQPRGQRLDTPEKLDVYNGLFWGHLAAGVGFGAAYGAGVVEALLKREDVVEASTTRRPLSAEEARAMRSAPPPVMAP